MEVNWTFACLILRFGGRIRFSTSIWYPPLNHLRANIHCYYSTKYWRNWWHLFSYHYRLSLNNTKVKDRGSIKSMLEKYDLLSVNQLAAQIKLIEVWKSTHVDGYPIQLEPYNQDRPLKSHDLRTQNNRIFNESARLKIAESSFTIDSARLWNLAPISITNTATLPAAKRAIEIHVKLFPV